METRLRHLAGYLIFNVIIVIAANTIVTIQKRTVIFDSWNSWSGCTVKFTKPDQLFHESKITVRFWIVTIVLAAITIITLKIR